MTKTNSNQPTPVEPKPPTGPAHRRVERIDLSEARPARPDADHRLRDARTMADAG